VSAPVPVTAHAVCLPSFDHLYRAATWLLAEGHEQSQDVTLRYAAALSLLESGGGGNEGPGGFPPGMHPGDLSDNILDSLALHHADAQVDNFNAHFSLGMFEQKRLGCGKQP